VPLLHNEPADADVAVKTVPKIIPIAAITARILFILFSILLEFLKDSSYIAFRAEI
jgi:hypothetical protein